MQPYRTMTEMATQALREGILKGTLTSGTRLIPAKLESELVLGRVAIREAIRELTGSGLVESTPNKGTFVASPLTLEEIKELYNVRSHIEAKVAVVGAKRLKDAELDRMEELHHIMCDGSLPFLDYFLPNREFHFILYRASGWRYMIKLISQIWDQILAFRSLQKFNVGNPLKFNKEHRMILDALKADEYNKVGQLIKMNLRSGLNQILNLANKIPTES
jgi:DNA-binding GntR family transcriptional regulator